MRTPNGIAVRIDKVARWKEPQSAHNLTDGEGRVVLVSKDGEVLGFDE
ncbi:hypothetical protein [Streptomyces sp. NPDC127038]